jgi:Zn-finger nucleic acid-binding protein
MACPVDQTTLVMSERQGIEIDYCPTCRGVWLDRGELDKIIERSAAPGGANAPVAPQQGFAPPPQQSGHWQPQGRPMHHDSDYYKRHGHKRRKSFLEELFD